ncbi:MAG: AAA family ATPase [Candidatus Nitrosocosmicus sp.]
MVKSRSLITGEEREEFENKRKLKRLKDASVATNDNLEIPLDNNKAFPLFTITNENYTIDDLVISGNIIKKINLIIDENINFDKFKFYGLKPKQKILLFGEPGTGKTLTAKVISSMLNYPLITITFDSLISSYLGETASNLRKIFEFIRQGKWTVLFDEFDIISKKRDDPHEHGEIKRIVTNFMQMVDYYKGKSIIIAATNHQHLLDKAVWRRFDEVIEYPLPNKKDREKLYFKYLSGYMNPNNIPFALMAEKSNDFTGADIFQVCTNVLKKCVLNDEMEFTKSLMFEEIEEQQLRKRLLPR